jgi:hypothetical protein
MAAITSKTKKSLPSDRWSQLSGRLSDQQIFNLFDEYGLANRLKVPSDYDWVRSNLPNIQPELTKVLKFEADKQNNLRKEAEKARINETKQPQAPQPRYNPQPSDNKPVQNNSDTGQPGVRPNFPYKKPSEGPTPHGIVMPIHTMISPSQEGRGMGGNPDGKGGPNDTINAGPRETGLQGYTTTSPNLSLIKFTSDPNGPDEGDAATVWLADWTTKTFRPIMSMQAMQDMYPGDQNFQSALNSITTLNPSELQSGGKLSGFMDLGADYGVFEGGVTKPLDFNPQDLNNAYGKAKSEQATLNGVQAYDSFMKFLQSPDSGINSAFLSTVANDTGLSAMYINALAYGNYTPDDIYKDIKRRELVSQGNTSLNNTVVISTNIGKDQYVNTNPGRLANSLPSITPPQNIGNISRDVWSSTAANLSDEYYKLADPETYDPNSQTFKDNVAKIQTEFHDYILQALESGKESDAIAADTKWQSYKAEAEKLLGFKLSDNAMQAWNQLEKLRSNESDAGIANTGLAAEEQDKALRDYRQQDTENRNSSQYDLSTQEAVQAKASYSPQQIEAMNSEDSGKGLPRSQWRSVLWGLAPETPVTLQDFIYDFRNKYPNLNDSVSDDEIKAKYYDNMYDENGNYYSALYKNYQNNVSMTKYGFNFNSLPATSQEQTKINSYLQQNLDKEEAQQKDAATAESGNLFDPKQGKPTINYADQTTAAAEAANKATEADAARQAADKSNIAKAAAANAAAKVSASITPTAPAGKTLIPDVASMSKYTDITAPDANKRVYGVLKPTTTPVATPTPSKTASTPLAAATTAPTTVPTSVNTLKAYKNGQVVYVKPGTYNPGVSATLNG